MNAIEIRELSKQYKDLTAVDRLSLEIGSGELFSLLGVNGAGKTTTIKMLSCLTRPSAGDALLNGRSVLRDSAAVKSIIAVSPQETAVAPQLSTRENLEFMAGIHGMSKGEAREKCIRLSRQLGLDVLARSELWELNRGLKGKITVILTTHYMEEAEALSDRTGIMKNGRLIAVGTPHEIKARAGTDRFEEAFIRLVKEAE